MGTGTGVFSDASTLDYTNPVRRDVALLPAAGYLVIGFFTDNPGAWLMHCHIVGAPLVHLPQARASMLINSCIGVAYWGGTWCTVSREKDGDRWNHGSWFVAGKSRFKESYLFTYEETNLVVADLYELG